MNNVNETKYQFNKTENTKSISYLKTEWHKTLTAPQDDMWEAFTNYATQWEIIFNNNAIGYACVNDENKLLQFYVTTEWMHESKNIFKEFITNQKITEAIIGTNNPHCLSTVLHFQKSVKTHYYLFKSFINTKTTIREGTLRQASLDELDILVEFCHTATGGPKEWLAGYIGQWINKGGIFVFENNEEILGTVEVRKSDTDPGYAHLGMIVSPTQRKKGLGTYLLGKAKEKAIEWNLEPICGCDFYNVGSLKAIHSNGFRSLHQMLLMKF